jgi:hypothetical protein
VLFLVVAFIAYQFRAPAPLPDLTDDYHPHRAAWLGVTWSMAAHTDTEIETLAGDLQTQGIDHAFVYVSYLKADGIFNPTYDFSAEFTHRLRTLALDINLLGWVGVPITITQPDGQTVPNRLTDPAVRTRIAAFSAQVVTEMGFDGVHLNAELIPDGDPGFLATLRDIRETLPAGAILSSTAHALRVTEPVTIVPYPTQTHHWSADYLRQVAGQVDQLALMAYDSGLFLPTDYRAWVAYQVRNSTEALKAVEIDFLIGLPTSEEWTRSHHVIAETLHNALYGVRIGLSQIDTSIVDGIALYPYWEMDNDEWGLIETLFG